MSLTVRKIPFDLSAAIRGETIDRLAEDLGRPFAFFLMAANVWAEWGEMAIVYLRKAHDAFCDTGESQTFVLQEARHAAALHQINKQLFGAGSNHRDPRLGRVPILAHPIMSRRFRFSERTDASYAEDLRNIVLYITALEATFALVSTAAAATTLELMERGQASPAYMSHAPFFYVFFYHNVEEAEHSHVSWEYYERSYGPISEIKAEFAAKVQEAAGDLKEICLAIARSHGTPLEESEVDEVLSPMLKAVHTRVERLDLRAFDESRRSFIRAWDDVWEARFRTRSESLIPG